MPSDYSHSPSLLDLFIPVQLVNFAISFTLEASSKSHTPLPSSQAEPKSGLASLGKKHEAQHHDTRQNDTVVER